MLGCSRIKMNRVEQGQADLTMMELDQLAHELEVSVAYFFVEED